MSLAGDLRRTLVRFSYPAVASYYRSRRSKSCPLPALKFLEVAEPAYRSDFYTLSRIVETAAAPGCLIAECGVYRGSTLLGMAHKLAAMRVPDYRLVGFDSFEGFPEPVPQDALPDGQYHARAVKGVFADTSHEYLSRKVRSLGFDKSITLVKGYFEHTLPAWRDHQFDVVHLDVDLYQSYMTCLDFFYPRTRPGGYIVFDEYDFSAGVYPGAQKAIDSFLAGKAEKIQRFPEAVNPRYFIVKQPAASR